MADFEGKLNLDAETSEIEIKGKFKLTEDELDMVSGGSLGEPPTLEESLGKVGAELKTAENIAQLTVEAGDIENSYR